MILVDREIAELTKNGGLLDSYDPDCLTNTGYDLRAKYFAIGGEKKTAAYLEPGESAFVASVDILTVPDDMLCRVVLKNSRIRQGFTLDAPVYQPGHQTRVFFRITNVSGNEIRLSAGEKYATLIFEQLTGVPDHPYAGAFSDEFEFSGLGKYQDIYEKQIRELEKKAEDLKAAEHSIYANVLVILTVFVALFSFLTTNLSLFSSEPSLKRFLLYNSVLLGCISFLVAMMGGVVSPGKQGQPALLRWLPAVLCFAAALAVFILVPG